VQREGDLHFNIYILYLQCTLCSENFEDTKGVIRWNKSKRDRQHIGQWKKTTNDHHNTVQKTSD